MARSRKGTKNVPDPTKGIGFEDRQDCKGVEKKVGEGKPIIEGLRPEEGTDLVYP